MNGWLVDQLPSVLTQDPIINSFAQTAEEIADTVRARVDSVEYAIDLDYADPQMLTYLASWLALPLDPQDGPDLQRTVLHAFAQVLPRRGTPRALVTMLEAMTGGDVEVDDGGGVFSPRDPVPPWNPTVRVRLATEGPLGLERLRALVLQEIPAGTTLELTIMES